ncbi:MAG TPA: molybdate ABC transporter substrate-binding protein, partial [Chloroflexia bacterium]|nr:molybdate ABC transporter substrate-binding protein [Chloroflexia bacterium]
TPPAQFNFAGSQALLAQLKQGASADLFITADAPTMDAARTAGLVLSPQVLARNSLVVVLPSSNPGGVRTLADLARPGLKIVLAAPAVPVGSYTLQVLDKLAADAAYGPGFKAGVLANVVSQEENVRRVLTKVQLGEADAGIVYRTDARAPTAAGGTQTITILDIPPAANVTAVYYIAVLKGAVALQAASAFQTYALGPDGQAALGRFGFLPAGPTPTP